jgi:hypothetical protein
MSRAEDSRRHAAHCVELARNARNEADRRRWLDMAQFWLQRANEAERPRSPLSDLVEV